MMLIIGSAERGNKKKENIVSDTIDTPRPRMHVGDLFLSTARLEAAAVLLKGYRQFYGNDRDSILSCCEEMEMILRPVNELLAHVIRVKAGCAITSAGKQTANSDANHTPNIDAELLPRTRRECARGESLEV